MGWSSGTEIMNALIMSVQGRMTHDDKVAFFQEAINIFEDNDWDSLEECLGEDDAFDEAVRNIRPEYFEEIDVDEE
jgi:hypothetical protein